MSWDPEPPIVVHHFGFVMFYIRLAGALCLCVLAGGLISSGQPIMAVFGALCIAAALCMVPSHKHIKEYSA